MTEQTQPIRTEQTSAVLDAQADLARCAKALADLDSKIQEADVRAGAAEAKAMRSESTTDFRLAREAAEERADLHKLRPKYQDAVEAAKKNLQAAVLADALTGARIEGQAMSLRDQLLLQEMGELHQAYGTKLNEYVKAQRGWESARDLVVELDGPAPRPEFQLVVPGQLAIDYSGREPGLDVAASLAKLIAWVQAAPEREREEKLAAAQHAAAAEHDHMQEALAGRYGEDEKAKATERHLAEVKAWYRGGRTSSPSGPDVTVGKVEM